MSKRSGYEAYPWFTLRAPLLPVETLKDIPSDPSKLKVYLLEQYQNKLVREAVFLGSRDFSILLEKEMTKGKAGKAEDGVMISFLRYFCRLSSRSTPFGTFAGFATGTVGDQTDMRLNHQEVHQLHTRPDMEYLMHISRSLSENQDVQQLLIFTPNSSLYQVGNRWHYIESLIPNGFRRKIYDVVTVEDAGILANLLAFCTSGRTINEIREYLVSGGWELLEVNDYIHSLTAAQVLVSDLEPVVCGAEFFDCLLERIQELPLQTEMINAFLEMQQLFFRMDKPGKLLDISELLSRETSRIGIPVNENHLIQTDLSLSFDSLVLDRNLANQVLLGIRISRALSSQLADDPLKSFREAFIRRYGDRQVSLVKVLDPETGIGLEGAVENYWTDPVPWIDDLKWGPGFDNNQTQTDRGHPWLSSRLYDTISSGNLYLDIQSQELASLDIHRGDWPGQLWTVLELFQDDSMDSIQSYLKISVGGHPASLLGRFGFSDPGETMRWSKRLTADEMDQHPERLYAEVVHLPEDRTGNILQRPAFYEFEIPFLARSVKPANRQIHITDLLVSVRNGKVVLTSASTGKQIEPRMTNAYNHDLGNLSLYKFLNRIQLQDIDAAWKPSWGDSARKMPFIPGIRFRNLILAAPSWTCKPGDFGKWINAPGLTVDTRALLEWKNSKQMPDAMVWIHGDQELFFTWSNASLILALWDVIHHIQAVTFRPFYLSRTPVMGQGGSYANQIVLCYKQV